jgi:hypothetical protein
MHLKNNKSAKMSKMSRTGLMIFLIIAGIVFASGCIGGEKAIDTKSSTVVSTQTPVSVKTPLPTQASVSVKTPTKTPVSQESNATSPDLLIKPSDVPGLSLKDYNFYSVNEKDIYIIKNYIGSLSAPPGYYKTSLPAGSRNIGQTSTWKGDGIQVVNVEVLKFDSDAGIKDYFDSELKKCDNMVKQDQQKQGQCGSLSIGDNSYYTSVIPTNAWLTFSQRNYHVDIRVTVNVTDEKDKGLNEAIRIGNIIKSRLN